MKIAVNDLEHSPRVNVRSGLDKATIARYVEAYQAGEIFEPVIVFCEAGTERFVIADGSHRTEAAKQAGVTEIDVDIRTGDETDALKFALRCNAKHGLLRRDGDVLACIRSLMLDPVLSEQYKTHTERSELLGMNYKTFQRHFAKWRQSKGGTREERALKEDLQERADKHTTPASHGETTEKPAEPDNVSGSEADDVEQQSDARDEEQAAPAKAAPKPRQRPELTPEQKKIAKQVRETEQRNRKARELDEANKQALHEGIQSFRAIPVAAADAAKRWTDVEVDQVKHVMQWCSEFIAERERMAKAA